MKKILFFLVPALFCASLAAQDFSDISIMINPGHGGHDSDDRFISQTGFWESEGNLIKGLFLRDLLEDRGCTVLMSRITNTTADDIRPLSQICEIANQNNVDFFHSIHSNATGSVNYPLVLFHGYDNLPQFAESKVYASTLWYKLYGNETTCWTYHKLNIRGDSSFYGYALGVLSNLNMPGVLSEGSFHDYTPESFRLTNEDFCKLEAWNIYSAYLVHYQKDTDVFGTIAGTVKDMNRSVDYWYAPSSTDQYLPLNNATVRLLPAGTEYVTDEKNNGFFFFDSLAPGNYQLIISAEDYFNDTVDVEVTSGVVSYANRFLEPDRTMPPVVISWSPEGTDSVSSTSTIEVRFNMSMDTVHTAAAFSITPPVEGTIVWSDEAKLLQFTPDVTYEKQTIYTVTIDTTAAHAWGVELEDPFAYSFVTYNRNRLLLMDSYPKDGLTGVSPNLQFRLIFDAALDQTTLIGNVLLLDKDNNSIGTKSGKVTSSEGKGIYTFLPKTALTYGASYRLTIHGDIRDGDGNPLYDTISMAFNLTDAEENLDTLVDAFDLSGSWSLLADSCTGYTAGSTSLATYLVKMQGTNSHKLVYAYNELPGRIYMDGPDKIIDSATAQMSCWIYGDLGYNILALQIENCNGEMLQVVADTIDFAGWALKSFSLPESLKGCYGRLKGMELIRTTDGAKAGEIYLDALTLELRSDDSGVQIVPVGSFILYPNPTNETVHVLLSGSFSGGCEISIIDLSGKTIKSCSLADPGKYFSFDLPGIESGIYMIRVKNSSVESTQKLVISGKR